MQEMQEAEIQMRFADKIIQFIDNEDPRWGMIQKWKLREYIAKVLREYECSNFK